MDFVFFIPPLPFYEGTRAKFEASLDSCWYGRVVLLSSILVKTDQKDRDGRSVCMRQYDYVGRPLRPGLHNLIFVHLIDLTFYACLTRESPRGGDRQERAKQSCCISRSRIQRSTLCQLPQFRAGCLSRPCWRPRNHPCCCEEQQEPALQIWSARQRRAPREWQHALLHQPVGHVLAP